MIRFLALLWSCAIGSFIVIVCLETICKIAARVRDWFR